MNVNRLVHAVQNAKVVQGEYDFPMWDGKRGYVAHILTDMDEKAAYKYACDMVSRCSDMRSDGVKYGVISLFA